VDLASEKRTADIEGDNDEPSKEGNRSDNDIPLPDRNAMCVTWELIKTS
jgi:hypothetical protein